MVGIEHGVASIQKPFTRAGCCRKFARYCRSNSTSNDRPSVLRVPRSNGLSPCTKVFVDPRDLPVRISTSWAPKFGVCSGCNHRERAVRYGFPTDPAHEESGLHQLSAGFRLYPVGVVRSSFTEGSNLRCERHRNRRAAISKTTLRILYVFVVLEVGTGGFCIGT
jgi:hypothetical protein